MRTPTRRDGWPISRAILFVSGVALGVGVAWFATEFALFAFSDASQDRSELLRRALDLLPWQLALFALVGVALLPVARALALSWVGVGWWAVGVASFVFLGARVGEGALRQGGAGRAVLAVAAVGLILAGALAALRGVGRLLPPALRGAWPLAAWSGWTLLFLTFLRRAGPAFGNGKTGLIGWVEFLHGDEVLSAAALCGLVLLASAGLRWAFGERASFIR
jgi:hypothetical protein